MPYRIDLRDPPDDALDRLVALGALDVEPVADGLAALMPDEVTAARVADELVVGDLSVSPAQGRDDGSVWVLRPRSVRVGRLVLLPADMPAASGSLRLSDGHAFGTGLHPTTALCLEALEDVLDVDHRSSVLDVGTGSGVLALAALMRGAPVAVGLDIDEEAVRVAAENARLNGLAARLHLICGGPASVHGVWPIVLANVLAAPLMEMAPVLVRRVEHGGRLVLSGIPCTVAPEVERAYRHLGMQRAGSATRSGWTVLVLRPSW